MCRSKHVEPSINFGIINPITKLHFVGIATEKNILCMKMGAVSTLPAVQGQVTAFFLERRQYSLYCLHKTQQ